MNTTTNAAVTKNTIKYFADRGYIAEIASQYLIFTKSYDEQNYLLVTTHNGLIHLELRFPMTAMGAAAQAAVIASVKV